MTQLPIYSGFYNSQSTPVSAQRLINFYVQTIETTGALSDQVIFPTPGLVQRAYSGEINNANRGALTMAGVPYFVNGGALYSMSSGNVLSGLLGGVSGGVRDRVSIATNGTQLMILVPGGDGYIYNKDTGVFLQITDGDFTANGAPQYVRFIDGYFMCSTDSKKYIVSSLNNGLEWNALDFGTAESNPDDIVAPWTFKGRAYMMGSVTTEPVRNIGGADFPFQAIDGAELNVGVTAPFSLVNGRDHFYFIGGAENERAAIWRTDGQSTEKISTTAIDNVLQTLTDTQSNKIYALSYAQKGAYFVGFHLPQTSFYFDEATGSFHERISQIDQEESGWRVASMTTAYGKVYVGDTKDGRIGTIENETFAEYDDDFIQRTLITAPFNNQMNAFAIPNLLLTTAGRRAVGGDGDPIIRMSISRDGGFTYNDERPRSSGKLGEYDHKVIWRKNGSFDESSVLKFEYAHPSAIVLVRLDAKIKGGIPRYLA